MIKPTISLQELRRKIYVKAKSEKRHRFWGMYVHVCKYETLEEAYLISKRNNGSPGIDGVTFKDIETSGRKEFLINIQKELEKKHINHKIIGNAKYQKIMEKLES
ncbi:MAG: hypothetical protein N4A48_03240 [Tepidibacter sp.]|uniref:hypothetical protein n=1 Tax=Tepidibacter sp. TaxID=2529387 RepID=UPI0025F84915|nr:hypothetical protein [Tepidibacter sp.]MCT4507762.1 hypothetical protein [Tepidibacter sp.]